MVIDWPTMAIGDLAADDDGAIAIGPFGSSMKADVYTVSGVPVVRGNNLTGQPGFYGDFVFVPTSITSRFPRCLVRPGDLVFPHRGAIGEVGLVIDQGYAEWMLSTSMMKLRVHPKKLDPRFAFYFFRSSLGRHQLLQNASQVGTPGISQPLTSLRGCVMQVPPLSEQQAIVDVLRSLDDKLEQNRRTGAKLEELARAVFKAWFVDFEPVKAKSAGATTFPGMPPETFAALPTSFVDSELGPVPQGWEVMRWGEIASLEYGKSLKGYQVAAGGFRVFGTNGPIGWHTAQLASGPGIVIGRKGAYRGVHYSPGPFWAIDTAFYLKPKRPFSWKWAYYELLRLDINGMDSGSAIPSTSRDDFYSLPVCWPPLAMFYGFDAVFSPVFEMLVAMKAESARLAELRDYLLPKLLSGQVRVNEAKREVNDAS